MSRSNGYKRNPEAQSALALTKLATISNPAIIEAFHPEVMEIIRSDDTVPSSPLPPYELNLDTQVPELREEIEAVQGPPY
jgi:hypothetical protein